MIWFQALGWVLEFLSPTEVTAETLYSSTDDIQAACPRWHHGWSPGLAAPESESPLGPIGTCKKEIDLHAAGWITQ